MTDDAMQPTAEEIAAQNAEAAEGAVPMPEVHSTDLLRFCLGMFADTAWIKLGIRAAPGAGETKMDLPEAKLAIDALAALLPLAEAHFDPREARDLRNVLSSLQMNYVQRC